MQNLSSRSEPQPPAWLQILLLISALLKSARGFLVVPLRLLSFFSPFFLSTLTELISFIFLRLALW